MTERKRRRARPLFRTTPATSRFTLDSDCFGADGAIGFLTQTDVDFIHATMERQWQSGQPGPALDVLIPAVAKQQIMKGPREANRLANQFIHTVTTPSSDNADEVSERGAIRSVFRGNALSDKHDPDADALFETIKYGCDVFVSNDERARRKAAEMGIPAVSPSGMMDALRSDCWQTKTESNSSSP